jgi:hypothetical protein
MKSMQLKLKDLYTYQARYIILMICLVGAVVLWWFAGSAEVCWRPDGTVITCTYHPHPW